MVIVPLVMSSRPAIRRRNVALPTQGARAPRAIPPKPLHKIPNPIGDGLALPLLGVIWHCINRHPRRVGLAPEMHDGRVADLINYEGARTAVYLKALSPWKLRS